MRAREMATITDQIAFKSRIDLDRCANIIAALEKAKLQESNRDILESLLMELLTEDLNLNIYKD